MKQSIQREIVVRLMPTPKGTKLETNRHLSASNQTDWVWQHHRDFKPTLPMLPPWLQSKCRLRKAQPNPDHSSNASGARAVSESVSTGALADYFLRSGATAYCCSSSAAKRSSFASFFCSSPPLHRCSVWRENCIHCKWWSTSQLLWCSTRNFYSFSVPQGFSRNYFSVDAILKLRI